MILESARPANQHAVPLSAVGLVLRRVHAVSSRASDGVEVTSPDLILVNLKHHISIFVGLLCHSPAVMKRGRGDSWFKKSAAAGRAQSNGLHYPELLPQPQLTDIDSINHQNLNQEARGLSALPISLTWPLAVDLPCVNSVPVVMKIGDLKIISPKATSSSNQARAGEKPKKLLSFIMEDETGSINVLLWGDNVDKYEQLVQVRHLFSHLAVLRRLAAVRIHPIRF